MSSMPPPVMYMAPSSLVDRETLHDEAADSEYSLPYLPTTIPVVPARATGPKASSYGGQAARFSRTSRRGDSSDAQRRVSALEGDGLGWRLVDGGYRGSDVVRRGVCAGGDRASRSTGTSAPAPSAIGAGPCVRPPPSVSTASPMRSSPADVAEWLAERGVHVDLKGRTG
jgi:hypothetical protein